MSKFINNMKIMYDKDLLSKYKFYYNTELTNSYCILIHNFPNIRCDFDDWCLFSFINSRENNNSIYPNRVANKHLYDYYYDFYEEEEEKKENNY